METVTIEIKNDNKEVIRALEEYIKNSSEISSYTIDDGTWITKGTRKEAFTDDNFAEIEEHLKSSNKKRKPKFEL